MDSIFPRTTLQPVLDRPETKRIELQLEARYWADLRETLGELVIYSQLYPEGVAPHAPTVTPA